MKKLLVCIVLILLVGVAGLLYRSAVERPSNTAKACTLEAKVCPDGTSVGRIGPSCEFAMCEPPNVELLDVGVSFALPDSFGKGSISSTDTFATYERKNMSTLADSIVMNRYELSASSTANTIMMEKTIFSPKGEAASSMDDFVKVKIGSHTFYRAIIERFEGYVHVVYYLPREKDVLEFEAIDRTVENWMDSSLKIDQLPTQAALLSLLATLQVTP
jgi:hypothetical protein